MNTGVNVNGNSWKYVVVNFLIVFLAQLAYEAVAGLETGAIPTLFEAYSIAIKSFVAALGFYGINKITHSEATQ